MERRVLGIKIPDFFPREFSVFSRIGPGSFGPAPETSRERGEDRVSINPDTLGTSESIEVDKVSVDAEPTPIKSQTLDYKSGN